MEQQAKEELEMLESLYPNRFQYLKLELKSFISQHHHHTPEPSSFLSSIADTQESSSLNQRKRKNKSTAGEDSEYCDQQEECYGSVKKMKKKKDRVDLVLERAEACLRKIRQFKASLLSDL
ncbi:uncharacterized protein LOC114712383 isoform X2 [Neltuma alba]|uniref:uncharacterized protein LOC114712383 isoform X2 n=1 Tax=Neltuma alba TaxID=207710 RepID=UPI0010A47055|nr:uncharacterized protein LOC114712383 isoform X2 [Prosopis alba]